MDSLLKEVYQVALNEIKANVDYVPGYDKPVLLEGGQYEGVWLEGGLLSALAFRNIDPQVMVDSHDLFFHYQKEDGQIPAVVAKNKIYWGQIQMVVPIASTSLLVYQLTQDMKFLKRAYECCSKWDGWLEKYRMNGKYYLCKLYCDWDTGHDNSQRTRDLPHECPGIDAKVMPDLPQLPLYAPDLSATVYSGRIALSNMADILGLETEKILWETKAEKVKQAIYEHCYDPETMWFYDIYEDGSFRKIMGDAGLRVLQEHAVDRELACAIIRKNVLDPEKFWTAYPLPSVSPSDPQFESECFENHWAGACQGHLTLRTLRWFDYYGFTEEHKYLMNQFIKAILTNYTKADKKANFTQQFNPFTGELNTTEQYTPALASFLEFVWKLYPNEFPKEFQMNLY